MYIAGRRLTCPGAAGPVALTVLAAMLLVACGNANTAFFSGSAGGGATPRSSSAELGAAGKATSGADTSHQAAPPPQAQGASAPLGGGAGVPEGAKIERDASVALAVKRGEFDSTLDRIFALMREMKGYAAGSNIQGDDGGLRTGSVSIKVPAERFQDTIDRLRKLGTLESLNVGGTDVSAEYVDLKARLKNQQAQEQAMLALFSKANSVPDIVTVQQQLAGIREQIERFQGRINFLDQAVNYATVNIAVRQAGVGVTPGDEWGFKSALVQAAHYFVNTVNGVVVVLGASGPILVAVLGLAVFIWRRRHQLRRPAAPPAPAT